MLSKRGHTEVQANWWMVAESFQDSVVVSVGTLVENAQGRQSVGIKWVRTKGKELVGTGKRVR
jgi:hypothetical protein